MISDLLIVFIRNAELGKVKTRLAAKIGNAKALKIYEKLLDHTYAITKATDYLKLISYSEEITSDELWMEPEFEKTTQHGNDLGDRMSNAFSNAFESGYKRVVLIGSDCYDLKAHHLKTAFESLESHDYVIGPALDGGYYLVGMKRPDNRIFRNKSWGKSTVLSETFKELDAENVFLLEPLNDIDTLEDLKSCPSLLKYLETDEKIHKTDG